MTVRQFLAMLCAGLLLGACASKTATPANTDKPTPPAAQPPPAPNGRAVHVLNGHDGSPVSWESLVAATAGAEVVVIGENHGHPLGLAMAAALWEDVLALPQGMDAALSMEFFERDQQVALDAYLAGIADERGFKRATGKTTDAAYPAGHRAMVEAAKAKGKPVIASNAPRIYVSYAGKEPFEKLRALPEEHRRLFRVPDSLPTGRYRADYNAIMDTPHVFGPDTPKPETPEEKTARLDRGFRAQSLWDWTMAESVVRGLEARRAPVVHVVGRFHSDFRGGTIEAIEKLRPGTKVITISTIDDTAPALRAEDKDRADFVIYIGLAPAEPVPAPATSPASKSPGAGASPK